MLEVVALLKQINEKLLSQTDVADIENEIVDTEEYMIDLESRVRKTRREFMRQDGTRSDATPTDSAAGMANIRENNNNNISSQPSVRSEVSFPTFITSSASKLRLPKLTFPTFSRKTLEWTTFWDSFESNIHLNSALPDIQKFSYLKSLTQYAAARVIDGFPLTTANYVKAVELSQERFGQPHTIINAYIQALVESSLPSKSIQCLQIKIRNEIL